MKGKSKLLKIAFVVSFCLIPYCKSIGEFTTTVIGTEVFFGEICYVIETRHDGVLNDWEYFNIVDDTLRIRGYLVPGVVAAMLEMIPFFLMMRGFLNSSLLVRVG